jgi:hypothetical protein
MRITLFLAHFASLPGGLVSHKGNLDFVGGRVKTAGAMGRSKRTRFFAVAAIGITALGGGAVRADHTCDPVTDAGWSVAPSHETVSETDSAPYQEGTAGNWFVARTTAYIPFCNYYNELGIYSMRSYTLSPRTREERVGVCRASAQGGSIAVAPYAGPCPPR